MSLGGKLRHVACVLLFALAVLSGGCAPAHVYDVVEFGSTKPIRAVPFNALRLSVHGVVYNRVTGAKLKQIIVGSRLYNDDDLSTEDGPGEFRIDGTFVSIFSGRVRTVRRGSFHVYRDWVCVYVQRQRCFAIFKDDSGRYLAIGPSTDAVASRIHFERLPPRD
jgi:hypothetical protein